MTDKITELTDFINRTSGSPNYQRIEVGDRVIKGGRTGSHLTWDQLWNAGGTLYGMTVCDIGCFNGYFCFKAEEAGARSVTGYDTNSPAVEISKRVGEVRESSCKFEVKNFWEPGFFKEPFDVIMSSNVLHHTRKQLGIDKYIEAINDLFSNCRHECLLVVSSQDRDILVKEGSKHGFTVVSDQLNHRHGRRVIFMAKWGGSSKIKLGDILTYSGSTIRPQPDWTIEAEIEKLNRVIDQKEHDYPHDSRWPDIRSNITKIIELVRQKTSRNQPLHMLALQTYEYLHEVAPENRVGGSLSLVRDPIRIMDCYNGIRSGVSLPPIAIKEGGRLHQGHYRCKTYKRYGCSDETELDYFSKEEFVRRKLCSFYTKTHQR